MSCDRQCCIGRSLRMTERHGGDDRLSDGHRELVVLDERVPGGDYARGSVAFQSAHRSQPRFQSAMVGFDRVVRVALEGMQG
jgi:hypothetical protein